VEVTVQLNIWSTYKGKFEINSIANRVISLLQTKQIDLSEDEFTAIRQQVDFFEAYPEEETGYNGVISLVILVQNMRRSEDYWHIQYLLSLSVPVRQRQVKIIFCM
jgi:hypothetical protein